jgi:tRNA1Val (adenine37-N6)-methyltransferase
MANSYFRFKQFMVNQGLSAMKVTTDGCLFGAWVARELEAGNAGGNLLDIGTGTGLLSLMIAQKTGLAIEAVEIDPEAVEEATENTQSSPWKDKIRVVNSDVRSFSPTHQYNYIVSNPPFYENELKSGKPGKNIAHHSNELPLSELLQFINAHLADEGLFFLLLPYKREKDVEALLKQNNLFIQTKVLVHQTTNHAPFRIMIKGSKPGSEAQKELHLFIKEGADYTPAFVQLLKDYYLYL